VTDPAVDVVVEVIGGIEPARELILAALAGRQAGGHRQQGAAGQPRRRAVRRRRRRRGRPAVRGRGGRRHPAHPAAARVASASPSPGDGHRQRHHQLHPHQDDRGGGRLRRRAQPRPSASATPSATPPPTSRASTPAPRRPSSPPSPSAPGSWPATCTTRASPDHRHRHRFAHRLGYVVKLLAIAEQDAGRADIAVRVHPAMVPGSTRWPACARASTPCSSRAARSATSCSTGGAPAGGPTASAVLGDLIDAAVNLRQGLPRRPRAASPRPPCAPSTSHLGVLPQPRGARPPRRAARRWPACSAGTR
jgi:hypothetical protein